MTQYYTYKSTTKALAKLRVPVKVGGRMVVFPTAEQAALFGAYARGVDVTPTPPEGKVAVADGFALEGGKWVRAWRFEDAPVVVHRYEKVRLYVGLVKIGKWAAFEEWAAQQTIPEGEYAGVNLLTAFNCVVVIRDDHPLFAHYYGAIKTALGIDDATAQAVLDAALEAAK